MAINQPTSSVTSQISHRTSLIQGNLGISYAAAHAVNPFVVLSDDSGHAIARTIGFTLVEANAIANELASAFNRQRRWSRALRLMRHAAKYSVVGAAVYALIVAACLFTR